RPPNDLKVIAKPTYECASIGIHADSVFSIDPETEERLGSLAERFRQPITIQEFVSGFEIEVPVLEAAGPNACMAVGVELDGRRNLRNSILVYDDVFDDSYGFYNFAEQNAVTAARMMEIAEKAHVGLQFAT